MGDKGTVYGQPGTEVDHSHHSGGRQVSKGRDSQGEVL
jgi:hypothetical protein